MEEKRDVIVIGGGPGGYVAALRASQLGKRVLLVEEDRLGGTCMNYGCIPAKYLLHQTGLFRELRDNKKLSGPREQVVCDWKLVQEDRVKIIDRLVGGVEFLLRKNRVEWIKGRSRLLNERQVSVQAAGQEKIFVAGRIILATGSRPAALPFLKPDGRSVITSREALELETIPESLLVVGAGAIGLELGTVYARMGTKVTVLELLPSILPGCDRDVATRLERLLKMQGLAFFTHMHIEQAEKQKDRVVLKGQCRKNDVPFSLDGEKVLLAAGRLPNSDTFQDEAAVVPVEKGSIRVNERLETAVPGVFAIGDLIGGKLLAHKASQEGIVAAENASGVERPMSYEALPMAVFTDPELASVGLTEEEAREKGIKYQTAMVLLQASGRALTLDRPEGMVKMIAGPDDTVLGAHVLAPSASEMIAELTLAIRQKLKLQDISSTIHIHPTLSESIMEAALKAKGMAIQVIN